MCIGSSLGYKNYSFYFDNDREYFIYIKNASTSKASALIIEYKINHLAIIENEDILGFLSIKDLVNTKENQST
jgi:hypothetical protein